MSLCDRSSVRFLALVIALLASTTVGQADTAVTNITGAQTWWWNLAGLESYESFTVGPQTATLQGFSFQMTWDTGSTAHVDILSNNAGNPGTLLVTTNTYTFGGGNPGVAYIPATSMTLTAGSTYFIHLVRESGSLGANISGASAETGLPGWSIGNSSYIIADKQWSSGVPMFSVDIASAVPEPATSAVMVGAVALGLVALRRRFRR
jgi:hypothetical protein